MTEEERKKIDYLGTALFIKRQLGNLCNIIEDADVDTPDSIDLALESKIGDDSDQAFLLVLLLSCGTIRDALHKAICSDLEKFETEIEILADEVRANIEKWAKENEEI